MLNLRKLVFTFVFFNLFVGMFGQNRVIHLLDGDKDTEWKNYQESPEPNGDIIVTKVQEPSMELYFPKGRKKLTCVLICPGGGYSALCFVKEGRRIARAFNEKGIAAAVLRYRLPNDLEQKGNPWIPLLDAQLAISYLNKHAAELGLNKHKIGVMGFSAGGHLAATLSNLFTKPQDARMDEGDIRPDFSVLIYPVITLSDSLTHQGTRYNLLGKSPSKDLVQMFSLEKQVTNQTPPTFLVHALDDKVVPIKNSRLFRDACVENAVPVILYELNAGGHGFGLGTNQSGEWFHFLMDWLVTI